jgi:hypothetical protein
MAVFGKKTVDGVVAQLTKMQDQLAEVAAAQRAEAVQASVRMTQARGERDAAEAEALRAAAIASNIGTLIGA